MKSFFEKIIKVWSLCPALFIVGCICSIIGVVNDSEALQFLGLAAVVVSLVMTVAVFVASLVFRRRKTAFASAVAFAVCLVVGFFAAVLIGAGQHHPPHDNNDEMVDIPEWSYCLETDSSLIREVRTPIERGSCWTDGEWFYMVKQAGETVRMEGYGLHEGGAVCAFEERDSVLYVTLPREGYTTFAKPDCEVRHYIMKNEDGEECEILVAFDVEGDSPSEPWRVLQRFTVGKRSVCNDADAFVGSMLPFVKQSIYDLLADVYMEGCDNEQLWHFYADGTVKMPGMEEPKPYVIELGYDMPTGVIRMPDGSRAGVVRDGYALKLFKATYDNDEELWVSTDELVQELNVCDHNNSMRWAYRRPVMQSMLGFAGVDYEATLKNRLEGIVEPMALLNYWLLPMELGEE